MLVQTRTSRGHEHQKAVRVLEETAQRHHGLMVKGQKEDFEEQLQLKHAKFGKQKLLQQEQASFQEQM
eukprot:10564090-Prorocentrum_lima.AAC.1